MNKNLKKVKRWLLEGREINDETHPINFPKAMNREVESGQTPVVTETSTPSTESVVEPVTEAQ